MNKNSYKLLYMKYIQKYFLYKLLRKDMHVCVWRGILFSIAIKNT